MKCIGKKKYYSRYINTHMDDKMQRTKIVTAIAPFRANVNRNGVTKKKKIVNKH